MREPARSPQFPEHLLGEHALRIKRLSRVDERFTGYRWNFENIICYAIDQFVRQALPPLMHLAAI